VVEKHCLGLARDCSPRRRILPVPRTFGLVAHVPAVRGRGVPVPCDHRKPPESIRTPVCVALARQGESTSGKAQPGHVQSRSKPFEVSILVLGSLLSLAGSRASEKLIFCPRYQGQPCAQPSPARWLSPATWSASRLRVACAPSLVAVVNRSRAVVGCPRSWLLMLSDRRSTLPIGERLSLAGLDQQLPHKGKSVIER